MTEPGAGADPTLLATRAVRDGDHYVINGHKWFTSNGSVADFLIVMAVTDPEAPARKRATMFVVPANTPGVDVLRDIETMGDIGGHSTSKHHSRPGGHSEITYTDVRVPAANRIGAEGDGFLLAQQRLGPGRIHHCMRWLGQSKRAFDMLCERAKSRYTHGSVLADKQMIQDWIATSAAEMTAARLMTLQAAWKMDNGGTAAALTDIAMIKFYGAQVLYNVIDRAIQPRLAGLHHGPAAGVDVPPRPRGAHLRRPGRGAQGDGRAPDPASLRGPRRANRARAHPPRRSREEVRAPAGHNRDQQLITATRAACRADVKQQAVPENYGSSRTGCWFQPPAR